MMADFRNIHTRIWTDSWFCDLEPDEKLLFIYLFSNPGASVCGMYEIPTRNMALDTGIERARVMAILGKFAEAGKVFYQDGIVWVVNLKKYNDSGSNVKVKARIKKDLDAISDCPLKKAYCKHEKIPYPGMKIPYPETVAETETDNETDTDKETETDTEALSSAFSQTSGITPYELDDWTTAIGELVKMGATREDVKNTTNNLISKKYKVMGPWSIVKSARSTVAARVRNNGSQADGTLKVLVIDPATNRVING